MGSTTSGERCSPDERRWALVIGVLLLVNSGLIAFHSEGRVEAYVGGGICAVGGVLTLASGLLSSRRVARDEQRLPRVPPLGGRRRKD